MLRGNALPRTPASTATPFANRSVNHNSSFVDENVGAGDFGKVVGTTKTPLTVGKLGGGDNYQHQQPQTRRRVALGDISNRKNTTLQQQQQQDAVGSIKKSTTKSTTKKKKKKKKAFVLSSANNTTQTNLINKRVNFSSSVIEPSLQTATKPRVLFAAPTPVPKRHLFHDELLDDDDDDDMEDDMTQEPVEDIERPAGRLWSAKEHGFDDDNDDPRDDISLEGARYFMEDLQAIMKESRIQRIHDEIRCREEEAQHYMEHTFSRIVEEQWNSGKSPLGLYVCFFFVPITMWRLTKF